MLDKITDRARELFYMDPGMILSSNKELIIENCRRIEEYNEVFMQLLSGRLCIQIWGSGLRAYDYRTGGLLVRGRITRIELNERSGTNNERSASGLCKDQSKGT